MAQNEAAVMLGRSGGNKTKELYGKSHYNKIAKLGAAKRWAKNKEAVDKSTLDDANRSAYSVGMVTESPE